MVRSRIRSVRRAHIQRSTNRYSCSRDDKYPPCNALSQEARDLRLLNKSVLTQEEPIGSICLGVPTPKAPRTDSLDSIHAIDSPPPKIKLKVLRSVNVGN